MPQSQVSPRESAQSPEAWPIGRSILHLLAASAPCHNSIHPRPNSNSARRRPARACQSDTLSGQSLANPARGPGTGTKGERAMTLVFSFLRS